MRMDQPMGITDTARDFLDANEIRPDPCPHCKRPHFPELVQIGTYRGFDEYSLYRHTLKDGRVADEYLQETRFSGGPMLFLGLKVYGLSPFLWSEKEMDYAC